MNILIVCECGASLHSEEIVSQLVLHESVLLAAIDTPFSSFSRQELCANADSRPTPRWWHPFTFPAVLPLVFSFGLGFPRVAFSTPLRTRPTVA